MVVGELARPFIALLFQLEEYRIAEHGGPFRLMKIDAQECPPHTEVKRLTPELLTTASHLWRTTLRGHVQVDAIRASRSRIAHPTVAGEQLIFMAFDIVQPRTLGFSGVRFTADMHPQVPVSKPRKRGVRLRLPVIEQRMARVGTRIPMLVRFYVRSLVPRMVRLCRCTVTPGTRSRLKRGG